MAEVIEITRKPPVQASKNYALLREQAIQHLQKISGEVWTDHNIHDPGITLLELVCYAITELAHKGQLDIKDLLASSHADGSDRDFYPARDILTMHPLTIDDFRKVLIDIEGIRNAWLDDSPRFRPKFYFNDPKHVYENPPRNEKAIVVKGLYDVLIEFDVDEDLGDLNESVLDKAIPEKENFYPEFNFGVSFPFLDEEELAHWRKALNITKVDLAPQLGDPNLFFIETEDDDFVFADLLITHSGGLQDCIRIGIKINSLDDLTEAELINALAKVKETLSFDGIGTIGSAHLVYLYNQKVIRVHELLEEIRCKLSGFRNLCEEFTRYGVTHIQEISMRANIEVAGGIDVESLLAEIFFEIDQFLSPAVQPRSLSQMQALRDGSLTTEEIFEGPYLKNGFLDTDELRAVPGFEDRSKIYTSDLINIIVGLRDKPIDERIAAEFSLDKNIISVGEFAISNFIDNQCITENAVHCLQLVIMDTYLPRLSPEKSLVTFFRNNRQVDYSLENVVNLFRELKKEAANKSKFKEQELLLTPPQGDVLPIESYFSIQEDLPIFYGVGSAGLPTTVSEGRKAQAKQLHGYLFFFEQLLANQLAQLAHIRDFFSISDHQNRTYFFQTLYQNPGVQLLLNDFVGSGEDWDDYTQNPDNTYFQHLTCDTESVGTFLDRRSRMLDHQLARYGEDMLDYAISKYGLEMKIEFGGDILAYRNAIIQKRNQITRKILSDKSCFLEDYVSLGQRRTDGYNCLNCEVNDIEFIQIEKSGNGTPAYSWKLVNEADNPVLMSSGSFSSEAEALSVARAALQAGKDEDFYAFEGSDFDNGITCGFSLYNNKSGSGTPVATSARQDFPSTFAAQEAVNQLVNWLNRHHWDTNNRSGLEIRIAKLLGMRSTKRRHLFSPRIAPPLLPHPLFRAGHLHAVRANQPVEKFFEMKADGAPNTWRLIMKDAGGNELLQAPDPVTNTSQPALPSGTIQSWIKKGLDSANYDNSDLKDGTTIIAEDPNGAAINIQNLVNFFYSQFWRLSYFKVEDYEVSGNTVWQIELKEKATRDGGSGNLLFKSERFANANKPDPLDENPGTPFQDFFDLLIDPERYLIQANGTQFDLILQDASNVQRGIMQQFNTEEEAALARDNILNLLHARYVQETFFDLKGGSWHLRLREGDPTSATILIHEGIINDDSAAREVSGRIIKYGLKRCHYYIDSSFNIFLRGEDETIALATYGDAFGTPTDQASAEAIVHQIINFILLHYGRTAAFEVGPQIEDGEETAWRLRVKDPQGITLLTSVRGKDDHSSVTDRAIQLVSNLFDNDILKPVPEEFVLYLLNQGNNNIIGTQPGFSSEKEAEEALSSLVNFLFSLYNRASFFELDVANRELSLFDDTASHLQANLLLQIPNTFPWTDLPAYLKQVTDEATALFVQEHFGRQAYFEIAPLGGLWKLQLKDKAGKSLLFSTSTISDEPSLDSTIQQLITLGNSITSYCIADDGRVAVGAYKDTYDPKDKACADKMEIHGYLSTIFGDREEALQAIDETVMFMAEAYSGEGFHMIEHLLIRPTVYDPCDPNNGVDPADLERFLSIPGKGDRPLRDPYSFQLTFILPDGCKRDVRKTTENLDAFLPESFLDADYRNFVERTIKRETPAHILPHIVWIPSEQNYGVSLTGEEVSMEKFERKYRKWLTLKEEVAKVGTAVVRDATELDLKRIRAQNELVDLLNLMY